MSTRFLKPIISCLYKILKAKKNTNNIRHIVTKSRPYLSPLSSTRKIRFQIGGAKKKNSPSLPLQHSHLFIYTGSQFELLGYKGVVRTLLYSLLFFQCALILAIRRVRNGILLSLIDDLDTMSIKLSTILFIWPNRASQAYVGDLCSPEDPPFVVSCLSPLEDKPL